MDLYAYIVVMIIANLEEYCGRSIFTNKMED